MKQLALLNPMQSHSAVAGMYPTLSAQDAESEPAMAAAEERFVDLSTPEHAEPWAVIAQKSAWIAAEYDCVHENEIETASESVSEIVVSCARESQPAEWGWHI
jgi:hypothetical protein